MSASDYLGRARNTARSFRPLREEERKSIQGLRLRLVEAREGEDLDSLTRRSGSPWPVQRTAVLNGVFVDARFREGELVKIVLAEPYLPKPPPEADAASP
jgi:predicted Zn-dependent protease